MRKLQRMEGRAQEASEFLKAIASPTRLKLLCALAEDEKSVSDLAEVLDLRQATVSQHLARLRREGLVTTRRQAQSVRYSIADETANAIIQVLYDRFCAV